MEQKYKDLCDKAMSYLEARSKITGKDEETFFQGILAGLEYAMSNPQILGQTNSLVQTKSASRVPATLPAPQGRSWLRQLRLRKNLMSKEVADLAKISRSHYCGIESGERNPSSRVARSIGAVLGFDYHAFDDGRIKDAEK